jgi:hypothetical protein
MTGHLRAGLCLLIALGLVIGAGFLTWHLPVPRPEARPGRLGAVPIRRRPPVGLPARRLLPPLPPAQPPEDAIDGVAVPPALADQRPIAVVIDNQREARPQWGLSQASRVYEALTEGGITRYLAVFGPVNVRRVGPVRSIRTQFLDYTLELGAGLAHVGGNEDALALIPDIHVMDLNEFRYAGPYRRIPRRGIAFEHTMYTAIPALRALMDRNGWGDDPVIAHPRWKPDAPPEERPAHQEVTINFSRPAYKVAWIYRPASNTYERILAGAPDMDAGTGHVIAAKTIAIAVVRRIEGRTRIGEDTWTFFDLGSGRAWVLEDGVAIPGTWRKASRTARLRFYDHSGREIALDRGPQWIEIIPPEVTPVFR